MHLLWHREHNRVAKNLIARHQEWDDEMVFQESRRIVIAEMQNVVYKEYLPVILGNRVMTHFQLNQPARYDNCVKNSAIVSNDYWQMLSWFLWKWVEIYVIFINLFKFCCSVSSSRILERKKNLHWFMLNSWDFMHILFFWLYCVSLKQSWKREM